MADGGGPGLHAGNRSASAAARPASMSWITAWMPSAAHAATCVSPMNPVPTTPTRNALSVRVRAGLGSLAARLPACRPGPPPSAIAPRREHHQLLVRVGRSLLALQLREDVDRELVKDGVVRVEDHVLVHRQAERRPLLHRVVEVAGSHGVADVDDVDPGGLQLTVQVDDGSCMARNHVAHPVSYTHLRAH